MTMLGNPNRHLFAIALTAGLLTAASSARATDTAFWKLYTADDKTYALLSFDQPAPLAGGGRLDGTGTLTGGAALAPEGKFGGGLRLDGTGYAAFPTKPFEPGAMTFHFANLNVSIEAWIKLDRLPEAGKVAVIVQRDGPGAVGCGLSVDAEGALAMRVKPKGKAAATFKSPPGKVPVGAWTHVAGVACGGFLSIGRDTLYVNGVEVFNGPATGAVGTAPETEAATLFVGGTPDGNGLAGLVDEVRLHSLVGKLWPEEPMPWLARIAAKGLPPLDDVLARERQPVLTLPLDGDTRPVASAELYARDPAIVERFKVDLKGEFVPGVKGRAVRGALSIGGFPLAHLTEGSLECWVRPYGVNNVSDRNLTLLSSSAFAAYFFNHVGPLKALSFYYHDAEKRLRMHGDGMDTEFHPGRWVHLAFAWDTGRVTMYIDGRAAASGGNGMATEANKGALTGLRFNEHGTFFDIDEIAVYTVRLTAAEVANRYWSYVAPEKMAAAKPPAPIRMEAWRFPSENAIVYRMTAMPGLEGIEKATLRLTDEKGAAVLTVERPFTADFARLRTPALKDGTYTLDALVKVGGRELSAEPIRFLSQRLPWEGNTLGVTDEVFPPFTPVKASGDKVAVVLREYRMNGFGLWDSVVSQGRELLAAPIRLRYETGDGAEGAWTFGKAGFDSTKPHRATYRAKATGAAVAIEAVSEIEMDGMMKVTLTLKPAEKGSKKTPTPDTSLLSRLWLEIPLKATEAALMHEDTGSMRNNYSGDIPKGEGVVWKSRRRGSWRNAFCGYLWMGGEERGLAWFAENDKGWITEKNLSDKPLQEIVREGDRVVLRVNLVNIPATLTEPRELVFGLQASPAKPLPEDWRTGARGGGLPVTPWGGHQCADKFPFEDRWEIVDKIIETQLERKDNGAWFKEMQEKHDIPPVRGTEDWVKSLSHIAWHPTYQQRPVLVYHEEMAASTYRREWHVYKDEWSRDLLDSRRAWPQGYDLFRQGRAASDAYRVNFGPSYRDHGVWYANEWLKRGVGIYWDNTYLTTASNPLTSEAYLAEDGQIQPALTLWNQREYSRRVWNVMQRWMRERKEKLLFLQHMTNAALLPILSWTTTAFDNEFSPDAYARGVNYPSQHDPKEPFPAEYLRAQSLGRQFGCYPALCFQLFQVGDLDKSLIPAREREGGVYSHKRNWGMARVHDIPGGDFPSDRLEKALRRFGYGSTNVVVHNYWAEKPALRADDENVKWLVVARPSDRRLFVILQSWSRRPGKIEVSFDYDVIGFRPVGDIVNLETGAVAGPADAGHCALTLDAPYDLRVLGVGVPPTPAGVRFHDDFADGALPRWSYVSSFFQTPVDASGRRVLRLADNPHPWSGPARIELWDGTDGWGDGTLEIEFRPSLMPTNRAALLQVVTRAGRPAFSQHGLSHTQLGNGQFMELFATPEKNQFELTRWTIGADGKRSRTEVAMLGPLADGVHTLALVMKGETTQVQFDGHEAAVFAGTPANGAAFGLRGGWLSERRYVELRRVTMRE